VNLFWVIEIFFQAVRLAGASHQRWLEQAATHACTNHQQFRHVVSANASGASRTRHFFFENSKSPAFIESI